VESGAETDVLDLTGGAPFHIIYDPLNPENGTVEFLDAQGAVLGTLTFTNIERVVVCFTPGTRIVTAKGARPVERLKIGDLVQTRDHGLQPIRWIGSRRLCAAELRADPSLQPIHIAKGALGQGLPLQDMRVSRQHRMLRKDPQAELLFGEDEVLVRAQHLTHLPGIRAETASAVTYIHILFDRHELVLADGAWSESFQPGARSIGGLDHAERDELFKIFPGLVQRGFGSFDAARSTLKGFEARVLLPA
jgi:Hint domain